jgi:hypothetical protein
MKKIFISFSILFLLSSCAGLISGENQNVYIVPSNSDVETINVEVSNGNGMSQTIEIPSNIQVQRSESPLVIKVKGNKCYKPTKTYSSASYNPMLLANVPGGIFGLIGTAIDMDSGAAWKYDDVVRVNVNKQRSCRR